MEALREKTGTSEFDGVAGDMVVGRHTWREYIRGSHEGWLGPVDAPKQANTDAPSEAEASTHTPGQPSVGDAALNAATTAIAPSAPNTSSSLGSPQSCEPTEETPSTDDKPIEEKKEEEEKPKP